MAEWENFNFTQITEFLQLYRFFKLAMYAVSSRRRWPVHTIQIGSFIIHAQLLLYLAYGAIGGLLLQYRFRPAPEREWVLSRATNAFWLWILSWKASYLLFHPMEVIKQPLSLLYFDGGERGIWAASLIALSYLGYQCWKQALAMRIWLSAGIWLLAGCWLVYHSFLLVWGEAALLLHGLSAASAGGLLLCVMVLRNRASIGKEAWYAAWFFIGNAGILFLDGARPLWLLSFSSLQIICLLAASLLLGLSWREEKREKGSFHG